MSLIKDVFSPSWLDRLGAAVDVPDFRRRVEQGDWEELAFKQRVRRVAETLETILPPFPDSVSELERLAPQFTGLPGIVFPEYVERTADLSDWTLAIEILAKLTQHSTSEFAVRRFLLVDQERYLDQALKWTRSDDEHVRRLASEGTRPRLPWGQAIPRLIADPRPALPILDALLQDPSLYVRKSVANHLNDISKTHPEYLIERIERHLGTDPNTDWILRHASRTLLKRGNPEVLQLFGHVTQGEVAVTDLVVSPVTIGQELQFSFQVNSSVEQRLRLEYAIDYVKQRGTSRKVFQLREREVKGALQVERRQSFRNMTTRVHYPGTHTLTILINGEAYATATFEVEEES
ncbi:DNA alkylation repair protein [Exiguobacterium sp. Leaf187]|uniref:DNA alkylation repair protein n=1 Tax=Exiguobacterium sp. Leaf187 TaxID=1736294 RepID=UPI0006FD3F29|nr:DNA alkylation repair protein [Exiguobacterium sp. Leaf187]KQS16143.1 DNA alkylation repair protein [Exiguobacterium sp. Leaf187]